MRSYAGQQSHYYYVVFFLLFRRGYSLSTAAILKRNAVPFSSGRHRSRRQPCFSRINLKDTNCCLSCEDINANHFGTLHRSEEVEGRSDHNRVDNYSKIHKGEIYVEDNFLTPLEIARLREDIAQLQRKGCFKPSGLSNRVEGDENIFGPSDRLTCTITPDLFPGDKQLSSVRFLVEEKMEHLKQTLHSIRNHRIELESGIGVMQQSDLKLELAEMYYSISPEGSQLPRHQDERHEDTKGVKGWINETRRSISWLIYLNCENWGSERTPNQTEEMEEMPTATTTSSSTRKPNSQGENIITGSGGELRAYCRTCCSEEHIRCGSHEGDLQVGWLRCSPTPSSSSTTANKIEFEPIFLDSWVQTKARTKSQEQDSSEGTVEMAYDNAITSSSARWQPMSALYRLRRNRSFPSRSKNEPIRSASLSEECFTRYAKNNTVREYLSEPFGPNSPSWPSDQDLEPTEFAKALALQLTRKDHQTRFVGTEDICGQDHSNSLSGMQVVDVLPRGGRLVLFDSVTVPHEVLEVTNGTRLAIAGWFHEPQQEFPGWYGT